MRGNVTISIKGVPELRENLERAYKKYANEVLKEIGTEGEFLLNESKKECPHDTGYLRNSGHTDIKKDHVEVGYSAEYAMKVHESLNIHHEYPTKAKYLEDPFNRRAPNMHANIAERLKRRGVL